MLIIKEKVGEEVGVQREREREREIKREREERGRGDSKSYLKKKCKAKKKNDLFDKPWHRVKVRHFAHVDNCAAVKLAK